MKYTLYFSVQLTLHSTKHILSFLGGRFSFNGVGCHLQQPGFLIGSWGVSMFGVSPFLHYVKHFVFF